MTRPTLSARIDHLLVPVHGDDRTSLQKARLFLGISTIVAANIWAGPLIGHGLAAIIGALAFLVLADFGRRA